MRFKTITLSLLLLALLPAASEASTKQLSIFQADQQLVGVSPATRDATLAELRALGVDAIKIQLTWSEVAPRTARKPAGFDGSDPADYPGFPAFATAVSDAQAAGFRVMLALSPTVPGFATKERGDTFGVDRPSATEFGRFAEAAGRRFASVDLWTLWNEPNHPGFLFPQATKAHVPYSPRLYRSLLRAGVSGLKRSGHGGDRILFGELLPIGKRNLFRKNTMQPIRFLRELFCLDSSWRAYRGRTARLRGCNGYRKITGVNGFAYHPYTRPAGPLAQGAHAGRRHDPVLRADHAGARHRSAQGAHRRRAHERLEHRVRLPVRPAGQLLRCAALAHPRLHVALRVDRLPQPARGKPRPVPDDRHADLRAVGPRPLAGWPALRGRQARSPASTPPTGCRCSCAGSGSSRGRGLGRRAARRPGRHRADPVAHRQGRLLNLRSLTVKNVRGYYKARIKVSASRQAAVPRVQRRT